MTNRIETIRTYTYLNEGAARGMRRKMIDKGYRVSLIGGTTTKFGEDAFAFDAAVAYPKTVTYGPGQEIRISAETAARDHSATIVPGTYSIEYTDSNYRLVDVAKEAPYYALKRVAVETKDRSEASVIIGGVPREYREIAAERKPHTITSYGYAIQQPW